MNDVTSFFGILHAAANAPKKVSADDLSRLLKRFLIFKESS